MKKICLVLSVFMTLALSATAFAAPTAADLTASVGSEGDIISFGIKDMRAMEAEVTNGTLIGRLLKKSPTGGDLSRMAVCSDTSLRVSFDAATGGIKNVVYVARLVEGATEADMLKLSTRDKGTDYKPDFTVKEPLKALATLKFDVDGVKTLRFARLELDSRIYLLATNGDAAVFEKMAAATEGAAGERHEDDNFWCQVDLSKELLASRNLKLNQPVSGEVYFTSTDKTLRLHVWSSLFCAEEGAVISELAGKTFAPLVKEHATADSPIMIGSGPLLAFFNLCCVTLPENLEIAQVFDGDALKDVQTSLATLKENTGLEWADVLSILRHNTTIGIAGKFSLLGTEFPGLWLRAEGLTGDKAEAIVSLLKEKVGIGATEVAAGDWKGFKTTMPVSMLAVSGPKGVIVALMDSDQLDKTPEVPAELTQAMEPRGIAMGFNLKDLQPELLKLYERFGDLILAIGDRTDEEKEAAKDTIKTVLNNLGMLETVEIYSIESECFAVEVTPQSDFLNMMFPPVLPVEPQTEENAASKPAA